MSLVLAVFLTVIVAYVFPKVFRFLHSQWRIRKMVSDIAGPPTLPFVGNSLQIPSSRAEWCDYFTAMADEYRAKGESVIRWWNMHDCRIIPLTAEAAKDILDSSEEITKSEDYHMMKPWMGDGLILSTGDKWRRRRKMLTPTFHFQMLNGYVETMSSQATTMTEFLDSYSESGEVVDLFPYLKRCALDIICETAMGYQLDAQRVHDHVYAKSVAEISTIIEEYILKPWLWFEPIWHLSGYAGRYNAALKTLMGFTRKVITDRQEEVRKYGFDDTGKRKAFLDMLLEMKQENALSDEDLREEVDTFMIAGHDTTASGSSWTMWSLACHPEVQEKVYQELNDIFEGSDRDITTEDLKKMEYLDRVMKETMRIISIIPFVGRVLQKDMIIGGKQIPAGANVLIAPLILHLNEKVYPNCKVFDPDRFLPENVAKRNAYDYIPFSAGPRNCIGQKFAQFEEKVLVASIIRKYRITSTIPFHSNRRVVEVTLTPELGVPVLLERRN